MYKHKCEAAKSAGDSNGILIHGKMEVNLRPSYGNQSDAGRRFQVDGWDDVLDEAEGLSLYCLDCDSAFGQVIRGVEVHTVEAMLQDGQFSEVEWLDE